ncbi:TetR/AcrR family transcriptional regulator [Glutamicibacter arilaitensis]|uniref:TetR family transcriptional regulator n=1 Tax=Glutamicibacter arilaitensis TaxID=256701 RepID=A0A2N7S0I7_9MICC|nr:TetR/AcrR family transcriptional regulator [Glutamicibacter arilaitensis]PMQ19654.1 TetR family transcriptional regulator [Glutamicibacter arilaitensis]
MQSEAAAKSTRTRSAGATRERILEATSRLFYTQGIRATSADKIIEEVGITKVTFYRHFRSKSDLVVAYLGELGEKEREWLQSVHDPSDPAASLGAIAEGIGASSSNPGFRGCAFINAAAEYSDPADPVREIIGTHRQWMLEKFADIASDAGVKDPLTAARQFMMLRDGAMVNGYLAESADLAQSLKSAFTSVLSAATGK